MTKFIEVTEIVSKNSVYLPVGKITAVVDCEDGTFIETGFDSKGKSTGLSVAENYADVKQKIQLCGE